MEQLVEKTGLSKSALGSYESDEFKDVSHYALMKLAKFHGVSTDYLLGLTATRNHPNSEVDELHLSDAMIELLKSGRVNNALLCELATHPDFPRFMAELEVAAEIMSQEERGLSEDSDTALAFICKRLRLNYAKLNDEEKKWLTRIANKSDLLKIPFQRRGKKN